MRICLVTPFAWSQPHDVNEHVAGVAAALRARGHEVTVLAPSTRAADLLAGRRALCAASAADVIAVGAGGPDLAPVAARASRSASARTSRSRSRRATSTSSTGSSPALPSLSYLALRDAERARGRDVLVAGPPRLPARPLAARAAARPASTRCSRSRSAARAAAAERFPGDYRVVSPGVDLELFRPAAKRRPDRRRAAPERARGGARRPEGAPRRSRTGRSCCCGRSR